MKIELHAHSKEVSPCGWLYLEELIDLYVAAGYDLLVLTNHYSRPTMERNKFTPTEFHEKFHETIRRAEEYGKSKGLRVLGAHEVRFDENANDYLVFGMTAEQCRDVEQLFTMTPQSFSEFAEANGILFYQAHPFRNGMTVVKPEYLFGLEVKNTPPRHDSRNDIALAWAEKFNLHKIAGSDCHRTEDVGTSAIVTDYDVKDMDDLLHILKNDFYTII